MNTVQSLLRRVVKGQNVERITVDVGSFVVEPGQEPGGAVLQLAQTGAIEGVADPIHHLLRLTAAGAVGLGSDYAHCGWVQDDSDETAGARYRDPFGVTWDWTDGTPVAVGHPFERATRREIARMRKPALPGRVAFPDTAIVKDAGMAIVCDAPLPGLLKLCFRMRGRQQFLSDMTSDTKTAGALLEWATEVICDAYMTLLAKLPATPDIVFYEDNLGHQLGLFVSEEQFRTSLAPGMAKIFAEIRKRCGAGIAFVGRGAISPLLHDLCDLGLSFLDLQTAAAGMRVEEVRRRIPETVVLHGAADFDALCKALRAGRADALLDIACSLALAWPVIAAPIGRLGTATTRDDIFWAADFMKALDLGKKASRTEIIAERTPHRDPRVTT